MKKFIGIAAAAAMAMPMAANAVDVSWGGEYAATYYTTTLNGADDTAAFWQLLRIKPTFKLDGNVSLVTSIALSQDNWMGDRRESGVTTFLGNGGIGSTIGNDTISLDLGYLQVPLAGGTFRIGRQAANWGHGLTILDDRRDRILYMKRVSGVTVIGLYDKRREGTTNVEKDDGNMYAIAAVGSTGGWLWGLLGDYWDGEPNDGGNVGYWLKEVIGFHPFVKGKIGPVAIKGAMNYLSGNGYDNGTSINYAVDGVWPNDSIAWFVEAGYDFGQVKLEGMFVQVIDGGLVAGGFDSYSMLINNSPENDNNLTRFFNLGGLGVDGDNNMMLAARLSGSPAENLTLTGAFGWVEDDADGRDAYDCTWLDLMASYSMTKQVSATFRFGTVMGDENDDGYATFRNGEIAYTLGINASF